MGRYARLLAYLRPYRGWFAISLVAASVASVLDGFTFALLIPLLRVLFDVGAAVAETPTVVERGIDAVASGWINTNDPVVTLRNIVLLVLAELTVGLAMGFTARLVIQAFEMAGHVVAVQMGFGMAQVIDPLTSEYQADQLAALGNQS